MRAVARTGQALPAVLGAVASSPVPVSRADVATATGLTRATVSTQMELLLASGLVREGEVLTRAGAGRPAVGVSLSPDRIAGLGLEVGVDYLAGCVRDLTGAVRGMTVVPRDNARVPPAHVLGAVSRLAGSLRRRVERQGLELVGATLAVPGLVDSSRGEVLVAPNLGWTGVAAGSALGRTRALSELRVTVDNEASLVAVAEQGWPPRTDGRFGDVDDFVVVSGHVGIGAGVVVDGQLLRGRRGWSGELGHVTVDADGPHCRCGSRGCLEVYAGLENMLRAADIDAAVAGRPAQAALGELVAAATQGRADAAAALHGAGRALGVALASTVNLLDVDVVVLGGAYARLATWLVPTVHAEIATRALRSRVRPVRVVPSEVGEHAAVEGAAAAVLAGVVTDPSPFLVQPVVG